MKVLLPLCALCILATGCATTRIQHSIPCENKNATEVFNALSALLLIEGLEITTANENIGVLQASTGESHDIWSGHYVSNNWQFVVRNDTVTAYAFERRISRNMMGTEVSRTDTYYGDKAHSDHLWYWNVRNGLLQLCGANTVIIKERK